MNGTSLVRTSEVDGEIVTTLVPVSAIEAMTRAELQIAQDSAVRAPRSIQVFLQEAKAVVSLDPDIAANCTYVLKDKRKQDGTPVSGPSIRLAEICAYCWRGLSIGARIIEDDGKLVTAQAVAMDLERNVRRSVEVKRGVTTRDGRRFSDDMVRVTCQAAMAIAERNVTFKVIPLPLVSLIEQEAQRVARGDVKSLPERTERAVQWFVGRGVREADVYRSLGIAGAGDMTLDLLATLNGYRVAVNEGHETLERLFAPPPDPTPQPTLPEPSTSKAATKSARLAEKLEPREPGSDG